MFVFIINGLVLVSLVIAIYCLYGYVKEKNIKFSWWKWILSIVWFIGMLIVFGFIGTAIGEGEPGAAFRGGIAFMILLILSGALVFVICFPDVMHSFKKTTQKK